MTPIPATVSDPQFTTGGNRQCDRVFRTAGVTAFELRCDELCDFRASDAEHLLMCRTRHKSLVRYETDGRAVARETMPGEIAFIPEGGGGHWCLSGPQHTICILIHSSVIRQAAEFASLSLPACSMYPAAFGADPTLYQLAVLLFEEMQHSRLAGSVSTEALTSLVAVHLIRRYSSLRMQQVPDSAGLPPHKLRCILDFIAQRYAENLELDDMAQLVKMTPYYFLRLFKRSTGQTPHQYLLQKRVDRAKELLAADQLSLADISLEVGFSNQSHFGTIFRKMTGFTPKLYRYRALNCVETERSSAPALVVR